MQSRRLIALLVTVVVLVSVVAVAVYVDSSDDKDDKEVYGIIGALDEEVEKLISTMDQDHEETVGDFVYHIGKLSGKDVVVVKSDMGKVNAAICATTLISQYNAKAIINTGVAGTLSEDVGIGDFVVSTDTVQHDFDASPIGYERGKIPNIGKISIDADKHLRETAVKVIKDNADGHDVFEGRICSGDLFVTGHEKMEDITTAFGGLCCEMEGGAVAQVCYLHDIPFVIIRAISDDVDGTGPDDYESFKKEMGRICAEMTIEMLKEA